MEGSADLMEVIVFLISGAIVLGGGIGVIFNRNPVHAALSLIASFFGVAVLFVLQEAHFLAFVQVVVYGGAIVVLFLFVIMLLGVDTAEDISTDAIELQKPMGIAAGALILALSLGGLFLSGGTGNDESAIAFTGETSGVAPNNLSPASLGIDPSDPEPITNVEMLGLDLFRRNLLAFEATGLLLTIATVGAVVLVRNQGAEDLVVDEPGTAVE